MAATLSVRPNRPAGSPFPWPPFRRSSSTFLSRTASWSGGAAVAPPPRRAFTRTLLLPVQATSRPDDSAPSKMSLEHALKLLGVSEGASFDEILRAKNSILATCSDDKAIAQVEAAYDMLLMQSLTRRRAGKVENSRIRYADAKPINSPGLGSSSQWLRNMPITIEAPSTRDLGIQAGVYGALAALTYVNGASSSSSLPYAGADVPGLILAGSFGASLYFMTKKNVKLGKATVITLGGLVAGAVVGSAVESWLQVDVVPFLGVHSPATVAQTCLYCKAQGDSFGSIWSLMITDSKEKMDRRS
ncbi:protein CHAPERONE-LIKE PROTEIN OF POR1, chloroplastic-like isoform X1 [Cucurbita maxima]|uniref:Protein CHAPERONE-LIKE PROTEIN OF POR1, chloroplastic-like isoform X1 n=1 Tax=Cucurbita maxima TaxID=3661 RepID=A0A6J1J971_CUCMA|nr:protein CHAPERONE-LIKE PROTEIN OF POR1, chloroplastic-like isoform X1 [Cucurbita maxima]